MFSAEGLLAVILSAATALCFAVGYVLQYTEAHKVPDRFFLSPKMLVELAHHRLWVAGIAVMFIGNGVQAVALDVGSLAVVEPILTTALLFALGLSAAIRRKRLRRQEWASAVAVSLGLSLLLAVGRPAVGQLSMPFSRWFMVVASSWGAAMAMVAVARRCTSAPQRAALIGGASGVLSGLADALTRYCTHEMTHHFSTVLLTWQPYALTVTGIYSLALMQSAYKAGSLTNALPAITVGEPLVGMLIGVFALNEQLHSSVPALTFEALGAAVMLIGTWMLGRSPIVLGQHNVKPRVLKASEQLEAAVRERTKVLSWAQVKYAALQVVPMMLFFRRK
jgi:drug/metabolite transporter (DMT)-like permease